MAQIETSVDLQSPNFPLVPQFMGRSVLIPNTDQIGQSPSIGREGTSVTQISEKGNVPHAYYMYNVVPTSQGYKSVAYTRITGAPRTVLGVVIPVVFSSIFAIRDSAENRGFLGVTEDFRTFIFSNISKRWIEATPVSQANSDVSIAFVTGSTYVCYAKFNIFTVDLINTQLVPATLSGVVNSNVISIAASNNYLILQDGNIVYWSSALNASDFVPSLATGAGSGTPTAIGGRIVAMFPLSTGYAIYTTTNIIVASYSGNIRYPWIFKEANNSAGVSSAEVISYGDDGTNYAWTSAGLLKVSLAGCAPVLPNVTDFLSGRVFAEWNATTRQIDYEYLTSDLKVHLLYSSARFVVISYGKTSLTHALIYDLALKRFGKLQIDHVNAFELNILSDGTPLTYADLASFNTLYGDLTDTAYSELATITNKAASPKRTLAFLQADGSIKVALFDVGNTNSNAVLILGKYQLVRTNTMTIEAVKLEDTDIDNTNFAVSILSSQNGKTWSSNTPATLIESDRDYRKYGCRATALNHSVLIEGAFNLVTMTLVVHKHGRR
jgi:hypothetical protein